MDINADIADYCIAKGARPGRGVNNLVPHDAVRAFAMSRLLATSGRFDRYVAVAPEGFVYAYFFERFFGLEVLEVHVDYPPTLCVVGPGVDAIRGARVLLVEDDVIGGAPLRLVVAALLEREPASVELYLGHAKFVQHLQNVPREVARVHVAEDTLDGNDYGAQERDLWAAFAALRRIS